MKFNVTHNSLGTYDVKLHWETKDKIKKIVGYSLLVAAGAVGAYYVSEYIDNIEIPTN